MGEETSGGRASGAVSAEQAVFLAALPYRRELFLSGGWLASRGPGAAGWQSFLRQHFTQLDLDAAAAEVRLFQESRAARAQVWHSVTIWQNRYPSLLRYIFDPPPVLFVSGSPGEGPLLPGPAVAIVGTRRARPIAQAAVQEYVATAAKVRKDTTIVSGFARGIDAAAHLAAIEHDLTTVAVLGAGLLRAGPASNLHLLERARRRGSRFVLCSEFPPHRPGYAGNFPRRNRIIAGLTNRTCVFQAPYKSGALISARYALDEGREVCAFDHALLSAPGLNEGARQLLTDGAEPIVLPRLEERIVLAPPNRSVSGPVSPQQLQFWRELNGGQLQYLQPDHYLRTDPVQEDAHIQQGHGNENGL